MTRQSSPVRIERHGDVALLVLDRPEARNAMNLALAGATVEAVVACQDSGAIVLTGADPAFCAGLDLRDTGVEMLGDLPRFVRAVEESAVPVIAAVNGPAVTGGFELALACDFMVASERASFADTHLRVGVYPGPVLTELPRRVGMAWAREMSLTGNFVDAATALRIGLVNHVVPHADLVPFAIGLARAVAEQDRTMVATMRHDWDETTGVPIAEAERIHEEHRARGQFDAPRSDDIAARRDAVLDRSRRQRSS